MSRGQTFGRYELGRRISSGGMAEVFRAVHLPSSTHVALKRILPEIAEDEDFIKMFEDEARIVSHLEHPHIARCLDFGCVEGAWFISFEYVDGKDLRTLFDRCVKAGGPPPLWFVVHVFSRVGEGLAYAHARKDDAGNPVSIVHRDVSPQNIIVSYGGDVKLIDFGIAKAAGKLSRTQVGTIKGKFGYMSPEQVSGREVDQRADIFSMGICMWELLTGRRLFLADNELLVLEKIRHQVVEPPSRFNVDVPPELDRIVLKSLAKNLDERYRAAREIYRDLNNLAQSINLVATREQIAQYMRRTFPEARENNGDAQSLGASSSSLRQPTSQPASHGPGQVSTGSSVRQQVQETRAMAADAGDNKRGSDLDIFEGLGKKSSTRPPAPPPSVGPGPRTQPPGPPPSRAPIPGSSNDPAKRTLMGIPSPMGGGGGGGMSPPSSSSMPAAPPSARSAPPPPPPPGRGSLPPIVAPPQRSSASAVPPPASTRPAPVVTAAARGADATEMDWDDEDEATHIFDKADGPEGMFGSSSAATGKDKMRPAAGAPTPAPPPQAQMKSTLLGMTSPLQPPPPPPPPPMSGLSQARMTPPPPPPSVGGAFARASSVPAGSPGPSGFPPPPTIQPMHAPPHVHGGLGQTLPMQPGMHGQTSTAPMPMPGSPGAHRGPSMPPAPSRPPPQVHAPVQASDYPPAYPQQNRMEATAMLRPHPSSSSKGGLWIALALLVVAAGGGAAAFMLMPRTGRIVVNVNDAKGGSVPLVQVFVDGKKHCDTVPCFVEQQNAGMHTVKVVAQGFDQVADQSVSVESKKDASVTFALTSGTSKKPGTGVKVAGSQAGVKLFVDDKEIGPLPQELYDMTPGDHTIVVKGSERYQLMEKKIIVAKDEILDMGPVTLKVVKGKATVSLGTPGAKVYLVSGSDRRELTPLPISVDIPTSQTWALEATKLGYQDYKQAISFDDGQAEKTFSVELAPKGVPVPTATVAQVPTTPTTAPTSPPTAATTAAAAQGEAYLNINSMPPSSCFLDGVPLGMTPKIRQSVKPGSHRIKFMHPEAGTKEISVTAVAGQTVNAVLKL